MILQRIEKSTINEELNQEQYSVACQASFFIKAGEVWKEQHYISASHV